MIHRNFYRYLANFFLGLFFSMTLGWGTDPSEIDSSPLKEKKVKVHIFYQGGLKKYTKGELNSSSLISQAVSLFKKDNAKENLVELEHGEDIGLEQAKENSKPLSGNMSLGDYLVGNDVFLKVVKIKCSTTSPKKKVRFDEQFIEKEKEKRDAKDLIATSPEPKWVKVEDSKESEEEEVEKEKPKEVKVKVVVQYTPDATITNRNPKMKEKEYSSFKSTATIADVCAQVLEQRKTLGLKKKALYVLLSDDMKGLIANEKATLQSFGLETLYLHLVEDNGVKILYNKECYLISFDRKQNFKTYTIGMLQKALAGIGIIPKGIKIGGKDLLSPKIKKDTPLGDNKLGIGAKDVLLIESPDVIVSDYNQVWGGQFVIPNISEEMNIEDMKKMVEKKWGYKDFHLVYRQQGKKRGSTSLNNKTLSKFKGEISSGNLRKVQYEIVVHPKRKITLYSKGAKKLELEVLSYYCEQVKIGELMTQVANLKWVKENWRDKAYVLQYKGESYNDPKDVLLGYDEESDQVELIPYKFQVKVGNTLSEEITTLPPNSNLEDLLKVLYVQGMITQAQSARKVIWVNGQENKNLKSKSVGALGMGSKPAQEIFVPYSISISYQGTDKKNQIASIAVQRPNTKVSEIRRSFERQVPSWKKRGYELLLGKDYPLEEGSRQLRDLNIHKPTMFYVRSYSVQVRSKKDQKWTWIHNLQPTDKLPVLRAEMLKRKMINKTKFSLYAFSEKENRFVELDDLFTIRQIFGEKKKRLIQPLRFYVQRGKKKYAFFTLGPDNKFSDLQKKLAEKIGYDIDRDIEVQGNSSDHNTVVVSSIPELHKGAKFYLDHTVKKEEEVLGKALHGKVIHLFEPYNLDIQVNGGEIKRIKITDPSPEGVSSVIKSGAGIGKKESYTLKQDKKSIDVKNFSAFELDHDKPLEVNIFQPSLSLSGIAINKLDSITPETTLQELLVHLLKKRLITQRQSVAEKEIWIKINEGSYKKASTFLFLDQIGINSNDKVDIIVPYQVLINDQRKKKMKDKSLTGPLTGFFTLPHPTSLELADAISKKNSKLKTGIQNFSLALNNKEIVDRQELEEVYKLKENSIITLKDYIFSSRIGKKSITYQNFYSLQGLGVLGKDTGIPQEEWDKGSLARMQGKKFVFMADAKMVKNTNYNPVEGNPKGIYPIQTTTLRGAGIENGSKIEILFHKYKVTLQGNKGSQEHYFDRKMMVQGIKGMVKKAENYKVLFGNEEHKDAFIEVYASGNKQLNSRKNLVEQGIKNEDTLTIKRKYNLTIQRKDNAAIQANISFHLSKGMNGLMQEVNTKVATLFGPKNSGIKYELYNNDSEVVSTDSLTENGIKNNNKLKIVGLLSLTFKFDNEVETKEIRIGDEDDTTFATLIKEYKDNGGFDGNMKGSSYVLKRKKINFSSSQEEVEVIKGNQKLNELPDLQEGEEFIIEKSNFLDKFKFLLLVPFGGAPFVYMGVKKKTSTPPQKEQNKNKKKGNSKKKPKRSRSLSKATS